MFTRREEENHNNFPRLLADCRKQVQTSKKRPVADTNFMDALALHLKRCVRNRTSDNKVEMITWRGPRILLRTECARHLAPYAQRLFEPNGVNSNHGSFYNFVARRAHKYLSMQPRPLADRSKWARGPRLPHELGLDPAPRGVALIFAREGRHFLDSPGTLDLASRAWCPVQRLSQRPTPEQKARRAQWRSCQSLVGFEKTVAEIVARLDAILYNKIKLVRGGIVYMRKVEKDVRSIYCYLDQKAPGYEICFNFINECLHGEKAWAVGHDVDGALILLQDSYDGMSAMREVASYLNLFQEINACMLGPYDYKAPGMSADSLKPKDTGGYRMIQGVFRRGHIEAMRVRFVKVDSPIIQLDDSLLELPTPPPPDHPDVPMSQERLRDRRTPYPEYYPLSSDSENDV
jgi:hypothetical protein